MVTSKCEAEIGLFLTATHTHTQKKKQTNKERKKGEKKSESKREYEWERKASRKRERKSGKADFFLFLNDNGFWEKTLTNFKSSSMVFVMYSYLVTVGYVK